MKKTIYILVVLLSISINIFSQEKELIINFDFNKYELKDEFIPIINQFINKIDKNAYNIKIVGYTDSKGTNQYNNNLGYKRANTVKKYFIKQGVSKKDIIISSNGKNHAIADNNTSEGAYKNRRVTVSLIRKTKIKKAGYILSENFEGKKLDYRIKIESKGGFKSEPNIKNCNNFGSNYAFGFGMSNCPASCFDSHQTSLIIIFNDSTYVNSLTFKTMEKYGNWGSSGTVFIDNEKYNGVYLGKKPSNDYKADTTFKTVDVKINKKVKTIKIWVTDITRESEIFIDDLIIK